MSKQTEPYTRYLGWWKSMETVFAGNVLFLKRVNKRLSRHDNLVVRGRPKVYYSQARRATDGKDLMAKPKASRKFLPPSWEAKKGPRTVFDKFFNQRYESLFIQLDHVSQSLSRDDKEDAIFLAYAKASRVFRGTSIEQAQTLFTKTLHHVLIDEFLKKKRRVQCVNGPIVEKAINETPVYDDDLELVEVLELIRATVTEEQYPLFVAIYLQGYQQNDITQSPEHADLTLTAFRSRRDRLNRRLKQRLDVNTNRLVVRDNNGNQDGTVDL